MEKSLFYRLSEKDEKMLRLKILNYRGSNAVYAVLVSGDFQDAGVPFKVVTAKPDADVPALYGTVPIEDKEWVHILMHQGIARPTNYVAHAGFQTLYVLEFDEWVLDEFDPEGAAIYRKRVAAATLESSENN